MDVRPLRTAEEINRYIDFGKEVYRENPNWVPPDAHHLAHVLAGDGGFVPDSQIQPFAVSNNDRILGAVTAVFDKAYERHWDERIGHLLYFEALPDEPEAVELLLCAACDWLGERGCRAARVSMLPGMQLPLTIDAYDAAPTIFHTFNPAYYHSYIKNGGFKSEKGAVQYQVRFTPALAERYQEMVKRAASSGVTLRSWDFDRLEQETEIFASLCNETFAGHWGYMPLPLAVMSGLTVEMKDFLAPDFTAFAEVDGQTAGFVYSLPDLNQAFHAMRNKSIEDHPDELQQRLGEIDHGVLLIIGVKQSHRGQGINLALAARSYLAMIARGYKTASYTVVLDDNWPSRRTAEKLGARITRNFAVYRKDLI